LNQNLSKNGFRRMARRVGWKNSIKSTTKQPKVAKPDASTIFILPESKQRCFEGEHVLRKVTKDEKLQMPFFTLQTPVVVINNEADEKEAIGMGFINALTSSSLLGMDTESAQGKSGRKPDVVQLASDSLVIIWNLYGFSEAPESLKSILEDVEVVKVVHDETGDTYPLLQNWGIDAMGIADTLCLAKAVGSENLNLGDLFAAFTGTALSKKLQKSNWKRERLYENQIGYAAKDAVATLQIFRGMTHYAEKRNLAIPDIETLPLSKRIQKQNEIRKIPQLCQKLMESLEVSSLELKGLHPIAASRLKYEAAMKVLDDDSDWPDNAPPLSEVPEMLEEAKKYLTSGLENLQRPEYDKEISQHNARIDAKAKVAQLTQTYSRERRFPKGYPSSARMMENYRLMMKYVESENIERAWGMNVCEAATELIHKKMNKLRERAENDLQEYEMRNKTALVRTVLHEARMKLQVTRNISAENAEESLRGWVLEHIKFPDAPEWEDKEFCEVALSMVKRRSNPERNSHDTAVTEEEEIT